MSRRRINFPLGVTMTMRRRLALLDWAKRNDAWIIEDDYDSEFRYGGPPLTALQGMDGAGRVAYVGTFSKILFPGLAHRLSGGAGAFAGSGRGGARAHRPLSARSSPKRRWPILLNEGHFAAHLRRVRRRVEAGRDVLVAVLRETGLRHARCRGAGPGPAYGRKTCGPQARHRHRRRPQEQPASADARCLPCISTARLSRDWCWASPASMPQSFAMPPIRLCALL